MSIMFTKLKQFYYQGSSDNTSCNGIIEASSKKVALFLLNDQNISVTSLKKTPKKTLKKRHIYLFIENLSTLLNAEINLLSALDLIASTHLVLLPTCDIIKSEIQSGKALHLALATASCYFDEITCALIQTGEASGKLPEILEDIKTQQTQLLQNIQNVKKALFYPGCVFFVTLIIMSVMLICIVPKFSEIYAQFNASLPVFTQAIMQLSSLVKQNALIILSILVTLIIGFFWLYSRSEKFRETISQLLLTLPIVKQVLIYSAYLRLFKLIGICLSAGLPLQQTLTLAKNSITLPKLKSDFDTVQMSVDHGIALSQALSDAHLPELILRRVKIAESCGSLDTAFFAAAKHYSAKLDQIISKLSVLVEPLIMVVLGLCIGALVVAMYLPLFHIGFAL